MDIQFNLKKRRVSPKDYSFHKSRQLGATLLPSDFSIPTPELNQDAEKCTAFSGTGARDSEILNGNFDPQEFWKDELAFAGITTSNGFDIEVPAAVGVKTGFSPMGNPTIRQNKASAYYWVTKNNGLDLFDSVRQAIFATKYVACGGVDWMNEWTYTPSGLISEAGKTLLGGHAIRINGWKTVNGVIYIGLPNTWGASMGDNGTYWMTREVFNKAFSEYGIYLWSDNPNIQVQRLGFFSALLANLVNLYKTLISKQVGYPPPVPSPAYPVRIIQWAQAIASQEGANPKFCNAGNLKFTTLTKSWGASPAFPAQDGGSIAKFQTAQQGMNALCNFLWLGAENELIAFHDARTLADFTKVYAGNPPPSYLENVCARMNVLPDILVSTFL